MGQRIDRVGLSWSLAVVALVIIAFAVGFLWMPAQAGGAPSLWSALCRAAGITSAFSAPAAPLGAVAIPSEVIWTPGTQRLIDAGDAARGSALAATCAGCHGANGIGASDQFPNLAAQAATALYKQLSDFHSGKRVSPIMQGFAATLTEQQMADLAAHIATLPAPAASASEPPRLVTVGDPARGLVACAACHGPMGHKLGAPELAGQKTAYVQAQLEAFAAGTRRNDINQQMRAIAHELRAEEISALAQYYGGATKSASPPEGAASAAPTSADTAKASADTAKAAAGTAKASADTAKASADTAKAAQLATKYNCNGCHAEDKKVVGPAYKEIAEKYAGDKSALTKLEHKVKNGGSGVWGSVPMPPNNVPDGDIDTLVQWVLSLK